MDQSRFKKVGNTLNLSYFTPLELREEVNAYQLRKALTDAAQDLGYTITFEANYQENYSLNPPKWTKKTSSMLEGKMSIGAMRSIEIRSYGENPDRLYIKHYWFVSDKEVLQYITTLSEYVSSEQ